MKQTYLSVLCFFALMLMMGCTSSKPIEKNDEPITLLEAEQAIVDYFDDYNDKSMSHEAFFQLWSQELSEHVNDYYIRRNTVHSRGFEVSFNDILVGSDFMDENDNPNHGSSAIEIINKYGSHVTNDPIVLSIKYDIHFIDQLSTVPLDNLDAFIVQSLDTFVVLWRGEDTIQVHTLFPPVPITDSWSTPRERLNLTETTTVLHRFLNDLANPDIDAWSLANTYFLGNQDHCFKNAQKQLHEDGHLASLLHILDPFTLDGMIPFEVVITYFDPEGDWEESIDVLLLIEAYHEGHYHIETYCTLPDQPMYEEPDDYLHGFAESFSNRDVPCESCCGEYLDWTDLGDCRSIQNEFIARDLQLTHTGCTVQFVGGHNVCEAVFNIEYAGDFYTTFHAYVYFHGDESHPKMRFYPVDFWHTLYDWMQVWDFFDEASILFTNETLSDADYCDVYGNLFLDCLELRELATEGMISGIHFNAFEKTFTVTWMFYLPTTEVWFYNVTVARSPLGNIVVTLKSSIYMSE